MNGLLPPHTLVLYFGVALVGDCFSSDTRCGIALPASDEIKPTAAIGIQFETSQGTKYMDITRDQSVTVPRNRPFTIFYNGKDEGGIKGIHLGWEYSAMQGQLSQPDGPGEYFSDKCTFKSSARKFGAEYLWYSFRGGAVDYAGNGGSSFELEVVPQ
jgi:hypothetical protein